MQVKSPQQNAPVALITGGARRIGAAIARHLHAQGMSVVCHYRHAKEEAQALKDELNQLRADSAEIISGELQEIEKLPKLVTQAEERWGRLDVLVNSASMYHPTPVGTVTPEQWDALFASNAKAPFFLAQACAPFLAKSECGSIINMTDANVDRPREDYPIYCATKAALENMTKALAKALAPLIRVNAVAPGEIYCDEPSSVAVLSGGIRETLLKREGQVDDIAKAVSFLIFDSPHTTGQTFVVDGGETLVG